MMFSKESSLHSSLRLHHAIQEFKKQQLDKSALERKLHILKSKCEGNKKKSKNAVSQLQKIKSVKDAYLKGKFEVEMVRSIEAQQRDRKIRLEKTLREQSKQNMHLIRNLLTEQRNHQYQNVKQREQLNEFRITQNLKQSINQKRQKSLEIKLSEEESRLSRTIYLEKKRMRAHKQSEVELTPIEAGTQKTKEYIAQMKILEQEMTVRLRDSQLNLSNSKLSLKKVMK